jgi:acetylglutamate/LysW-gamma-L-alpha-aminoadipate kinase
MLVIKIGGSLDMPEGLLRDIAESHEPMVVVHGANRRLDELLERLGHPRRMVTSVRGETSRFTDRTTMDYFLMAYAGMANKRIIERFHQLGRRAFGFAAMDGPVATARRRPDIRIRENDRVKVLHGDYTGSIEAIDTAPLRALLGIGLLPVLSPPALSRDGEAVNIDGDRLSMEIAVALRAERLMVFIDTPGFLRDHRDPTTVVHRIDLAGVPDLLPSAHGRARVKLLACSQAVERGVGMVGLLDGRGEHPLIDALEGAGTWIVP